MFIHTSESIQTGPGKAQEAFDAVVMGFTSNEIILPVIDTQVRAVADVNRAIVALPAIGIDDTVQDDPAAHNALQRDLSAARDGFCVDTTVVFKNAEDGRFAKGPASSLPLDTVGADAGFIHLDPAGERRLGHAIFCDTLTDASQTTVNGIAVQARQDSDLCGIQIECQQPLNLQNWGSEIRAGLRAFFHSHDSCFA